MKEIKGLLFDLDGTLLDSKKSVVDAIYKTFEHYAPGKFSYAELEARFGESWETCLPLLGCTDEQEVIHTYINFTRENPSQLDPLFPGVAENLKSLKLSGYRLAVVTNKQKCLAHEELRLHGIFDLFDTIITVNDVKNGKPDPEPVEKAYKELNLSKEVVLMIGDSVYDFKAASAAGVKCSIIDWYHLNALKHHKPDVMVSSLDELVDLLIIQQTSKAV